MGKWVTLSFRLRRWERLMLTGMVNISRFCRFLAVCRGPSSSHIPSSSRFAAHADVTSRVLGGKSGKMWQRCGNDVATMWQETGTAGGKNGTVRWEDRRIRHVYAIVPGDVGRMRPG